ncbi:zinc finger MYM-type protein 1-like [Esox lucius]|uniref:zinc finger MYM-type protein 1-like n=1 Tax=Esox lucius TaxID=8010 RepID=UPI0014768CC7|nr:zinc finger MYM-type protein 1-like [Esox lucius]
MNVEVRSGMNVEVRSGMNVEVSSGMNVEVRSGMNVEVRSGMNVEGRSFQKKWYENNPWLEYSPSTDAMFCFSCSLFLNDERYRSHTNWKTVGLNRWRKAQCLRGSHVWYGEVELLQEKILEAAFEVGDLESQAAKDKERERNREVLSRLIAITLFLARQGMSFRGDDETSSSQNQGNFLELVELFSKYDSVIKLHLDAVKEKQGTQKRPLVSLLSRIQKDIIKALAISVKCVIREEIQERKIFSIILDETTDVSHTEQVSFVVRYVHNMNIKERFIQCAMCIQQVEMLLKISSWLYWKKMT